MKTTIEEINNFLTEWTKVMRVEPGFKPLISAITTLAREIDKIKFRLNNPVNVYELSWKDVKEIYRLVDDMMSDDSSTPKKVYMEALDKFIDSRNDDDV